MNTRRDSAATTGTLLPHTEQKLRRPFPDDCHVAIFSVPPRQ
jgi:hypothetical protein